MRITIVVAAAENGAIGKGGRLPWDLPNDLQQFRALTKGKPIIMGRKTYDSIGRPLPGRENIVITRDRALMLNGCTVVNGLDEAIEHCRKNGEKEACVIGGADIYRQALPLADRVYLTRVHAAIDAADAFFHLPLEEWEEVSREEHLSDDRHRHDFTFLMFERRK